MARESLKLVDYSDRELLHMVEDHANDDGWADAKELGKALGIVGKRASSCVGSRLAWLRRYGAVEAEAGSKRNKWRVTQIGHTMIRGELKASTRRVLDDVPDSQILLVTREVAQRQRAKRNDVQGHLIRREWRHTTEVG